MTTPTLPILPPRRPDSHKGDFGRALLIGGSRGMAGAIALSGMSCLRSGAGLVKLAVPECIVDTVASFQPAYMTVPLACDSAGCLFAHARDQLKPLIEVATCVAIGPGLSRSKELTQLVSELYTSVTQPLVIDADALNALSESSTGLANPAGPRILTPHPGEFARLAKTPVGQKPSRDDQTATALEISTKNDVVMLLKGQRTYITNGHREVFNTTGNPGMATGGTGDVLTGIITALVCQGLSPFDAAVLGAHVHGLAGDLAAAKFGQVSLIPSDLIDFLPAAFCSLTSESKGVQP
jgi:ADP-dependent NAD(P)H-hydrate dehydratase